VVTYKSIEEPATIDLGEGRVLLVRRSLSKPQVKAWGFRFQRLTADDRVRVRALRAEYGPDVWPEVHDENFRTPEYVGQVYALLGEIIGACAVGLVGVEIEGLDRDAPESIARALEHLGLLEEAGLKAASAQGPERADVFSSGS